MTDLPWQERRLHFVGIGGAGMSGLALVAKALGAAVTGSDRAESTYLERLRSVGIEPTIGHRAENLPAGNVETVFSTAVPESNPERSAARERGLRELHRADLLAELTRLKRCIAVSGTHGKTTTSSMIVHMLARCGLDPSYLVGGEVRSTGSNAAWGRGEWLVVEADESDRSLLKLEAEIAVLTNLELDHHATFSSQRDLDQTLRQFLFAVPKVVVWDRPELIALCSKDATVVPFEPCQLELSQAGSRFHSDGTLVELAVPGEHNARNAAAALEALRLAGVDPVKAAATLKDFRGAGRRFELIGSHSSGAELYDDYAHHPTEVAATLAAARTLQAKRLVAVFQPHLYSRTAALFREFGLALGEADLVVVLDIYPAREDPEAFPGITGLLVAEAAADSANGKQVCWFKGFTEAELFLSKELRQGDLCLFLGAGSIDTLGRGLLTEIEGQRQ